MHLSVSVVVLFFSLILSGHGQDTAVQLREMGRSFSNDLAQAEAGFDTKKKDLNLRYLLKLQELKKAIQRTGDLENTLVVQREMDRFGESKIVRQSNVKADLPELQKTQNIYLRAFDEFELPYQNQVDQLIREHMDRLNQFKMALTKQSRIEEALLISETMKQTRDELQKRGLGAAIFLHAPDLKASRRGLLLHYTFEDADKNSVRDVSGRSYTGRATKLTYSESEGRKGRAAQFNGIDSEIEVRRKLDPDRSKALTIMGWFKCSDPPQGGFIFGWEGETTGNGGSRAWINRGKFGARIGGPTENNGVVDVHLRPDTWHHFALVHEQGKKNTYYLNGEIIKQDDAVPLKDHDPTLWIGASYNSLGDRNYFKGWIDDFLVFARPLPRHEILAMYGLKRWSNWTVVMRSRDPSLWNSNAGQPDKQNGYSIFLSHLPKVLNWLKLTRLDTGESLIIPVQRRTLRGTTKRWEGRNPAFGEAHRLGIAGEKSGAATGDVLVKGNLMGSGWGVAYGAEAETATQKQSWLGTPVTNVVFEISVKNLPLSEEEKKLLVK